MVIRNEGDVPADLGGWSVSGSKGDERYTFPGGYSLPSGGEVDLHSGSGGVDAWPTDIYWTTNTVWNNKGETVYLRDAGGTVVQEYSYR